MQKFTKGFIIGIFTGAIIMLMLVCLLGWWYTINHPIDEEIIIVDSIPSDTVWKSYDSIYRR